MVITKLVVYIAQEDYCAFSEDQLCEQLTTFLYEAPGGLTGGKDGVTYVEMVAIDSVTRTADIPDYSPTMDHDRQGEIIDEWTNLAVNEFVRDGYVPNSAFVRNS